MKSGGVGLPASFTGERIHTWGSWLHARRGMSGFVPEQTGSRSMQLALAACWREVWGGRLGVKGTLNLPHPQQLSRGSTSNRDLSQVFLEMSGIETGPLHAKHVLDH